MLIIKVLSDTAVHFRRLLAVPICDLFALEALYTSCVCWLAAVVVSACLGSGSKSTFG